MDDNTTIDRLKFYCLVLGLMVFFFPFNVQAGCSWTGSGDYVCDTHSTCSGLRFQDLDTLDIEENRISSAVYMTAKPLMNRPASYTVHSSVSTTVQTVKASTIAAGKIFSAYQSVSPPYRDRAGVILNDFMKGKSAQDIAEFNGPLIEKRDGVSYFLGQPL